MRQAAATILTLVVIGGVLWLSRAPANRGLRGRSLAETPTAAALPTEQPYPTDEAKQTIYDMVEATRKGDIKAYLKCFDSDLRTRIEQTIESKGREAFLEGLRRTDEQTMGVAILDSDTEILDKDRVRLKVDLVFRDGHQEQWYEVQRRGAKWAIVAIRGGPRQKSAMPYGSEVGPLVLPTPTPTGQSGETGLVP